LAFVDSTITFNTCATHQATAGTHNTLLLKSDSKILSYLCKSIIN
jgi:hypothetical protein